MATREQLVDQMIREKDEVLSNRPDAIMALLKFGDEFTCFRFGSRAELKSWEINTGRTDVVEVVQYKEL